jgi:hypothetical protein
MQQCAHAGVQCNSGARLAWSPQVKVARARAETPPNFRVFLPQMAIVDRIDGGFLRIVRQQDLRGGSQCMTCIMSETAVW